MRESGEGAYVCKFGDADVMKVESVKEPALGDDEVLVRMEAIGVNPVETYIRSGNYARVPPLPYTPEGDGAGVVEKAGPSLEEGRPRVSLWVSLWILRREECVYLQPTLVLASGNQL